jgi:hypothetical protein
MPWSTLTTADLNATKLAPLMSALRTAALADGQADPVDAIKATVIDRIRRMIAACRTNQVDSDTTKLPESLKALACRMIVREAKDRLEIELTDTEKEAWRVDERELLAISRCELPVDATDDAEAPSVQVTQPGPTISARAREFSRANQDGV